MDVKSAYLTGELEQQGETLFMKVLQGVKLRETGMVMACRIRKGLYGLKQSARLRNQKIVGVLVSHEF